jgi:hypothetical protein
VTGAKERRYDLSRYTSTTYTGEVVVAVSSYVGYWQVAVEADEDAVSLTRQNFRIYREENLPIIGDSQVGGN